MPELKLKEIRSHIAKNKFGGYYILDECEIDKGHLNCDINRGKDDRCRYLESIVTKGNVYEEGTINYIRKNCGSGDVVHAGALFGDFIPGIASALAPDAILWAFEPSYEKHLSACNTIYINKIKNTKILNIALGEKADLGFLTRGYRVLNPGEEKGYTKYIESILIMSLDQIIPSSRREISLIQLDVDLYEEFVLMGALELIKKHKPILILETVPQKWVNENILPLGYKADGKIGRNSIFKCNKPVT